MSTELPAVPTPIDEAELERKLDFIATQDLSLLKTEEKALFLKGLHKAFGISPFARAFDFLKDQNGKTIVYANRSAADQLAKQHGIWNEVVYAGPLRLSPDKYLDTIFTVEMRIHLPLGEGKGERCITSIGASPLGGMAGKEIVFNQGDAASNAVMKTYTKAWRRGVLQIMGCGLPDDSETDFARQAIQVDVSAGPSGYAQPQPKLFTPPKEEEPQKVEAQVVEAPTPITPSSAPRAMPRPLPAARPPKA